MTAAKCDRCCHFANAPDFMEQALPGLASLSSAYAAVRSDDGLCQRDDTVRRAMWTCPSFAQRPQGVAAKNELPPTGPMASQRLPPREGADVWLVPWLA